MLGDNQPTFTDKFAVLNIAWVIKAYTLKFQNTWYIDDQDSTPVKKIMVSVKNCVGNKLT